MKESMSEVEVVEAAVRTDVEGVAESDEAV